MPNYESSKNNKTRKIVLTTIFVSILSLGLINLVATNLLATEGVKMSRLSDKTAQLVKDNQYLSNEVSRTKSLAQIETKARELGFVRVNQIATIGSVDTVAQLPLR